jgi:hypothetical protein
LVVLSARRPQLPGLLNAISKSYIGHVTGEVNPIDFFETLAYTTYRRWETDKQVTNLLPPARFSHRGFPPKKPVVALFFSAEAPEVFVRRDIEREGLK